MITPPKSEMAFLEYSFLFDPREVDWPTIQDFERDLADYFMAFGVDAKVLKTIEGQFGRRILYLSKAEVKEPVLVTKFAPASKQLAKLDKTFGK
jgi:hypothetical protein